MKHRSHQSIISILIFSILFLLIIPIAFAATFVNNTTSGGASPNAPIWISPGWEFTAQSDTNPGESVCVEIHPQGDPGNYISQECTFVGGSGPYDWTCQVFTGGVDPAFQLKTIEYQFFVSNSGTSCNNNRHAFTGFAWTFDTGPTAVSLQSINAVDQSIESFIPAVALLFLIMSSTWLHWRKQFIPHN